MFRHYILASLFIIIWGCEKTRYPTKYIISDGYEGAVVIEYGIPNTPPLKIKDGYWQIKVPSNGLLQTSSEFDWGKSSPDKYYYLKDGLLKEINSAEFSGENMIWSPLNGNGNCSGRKIQHTEYEYFYIAKKPASFVYDFKVCDFLKKVNSESFYKKVK
jgi:hypothetical protein